MLGAAPLQVAAGSNKTCVQRAVFHSHKLQAHSVEAQQLDPVHNSGKVVRRCPFAEPANVELGSVGITCKRGASTPVTPSSTARLGGSAKQRCLFLATH